MSSLKQALTLFLIPLLTACGNSHAEEEEYPIPSFARVHAMVTGPVADGENSLLHSYEVAISGCAHGENNKAMRIVAPTAPQVLNLTKGDEGCEARLVSFVFGPAGAPETFAPREGEGLAGARGASLEFVTVTSSRTLVATVESALGARLEHLEEVLFSLLPRRAPLLLPEAVRLVGEYPDLGHVPQVALSEALRSGTTGSGAPAFSMMLECVEPKSFFQCGTQDLLEIRFAFLAKPTGDFGRAEAVVALGTPSQGFSPLPEHAFRNGFRFDAISPSVPGGGYATLLLLVAEWRGGIRVFELDLGKLPPPEG